MKKTWRPWIEMKSSIPFNNPASGKRSKVYRDVVISREYSLSDEYGKNTLGRGINIEVVWHEGDRRDAEILSGKAREQNVFIDIADLLVTIQEMYPEYNISFVDPYNVEDAD